MLEEVSIISECFATLLTLIVPYASVLARMSVEPRLPSVCLATLLTLIMGPLAGVCQLMLGESILPNECLATLLTPIGLLASVL